MVEFWRSISNTVNYVHDSMNNMCRKITAPFNSIVERLIVKGLVYIIFPTKTPPKATEFQTNNTKFTIPRQKKAQPSKNNIKKTLHQAALENDLEYIVKKLCEFSASSPKPEQVLKFFESWDKEGDSFLHIAARNKHYGIIHALCEVIDNPDIHEKELVDIVMNPNYVYQLLINPEKYQKFLEILEFPNQKSVTLKNILAQKESVQYNIVEEITQTLRTDEVCSPKKVMPKELLGYD